MDIEWQANNVWSSLKHLGTHDLSEFVPFAVSLWCLLMVGTIMSLHAVLLLRDVARSALVCWFELLL